MSYQLRSGTHLECMEAINCSKQQKKEISQGRKKFNEKKIKKNKNSHKKAGSCLFDSTP